MPLPEEPVAKKAAGKKPRRRRRPAAKKSEATEVEVPRKEGAEVLPPDKPAAIEATVVLNPDKPAAKKAAGQKPRRRRRPAAKKSTIAPGAAPKPGLVESPRPEASGPDESGGTGSPETGRPAVEAIDRTAGPGGELEEGGIRTSEKPGQKKPAAAKAAGAQKKVRRDMLVTCRQGKCRLAVMENDALAEVYIEKGRKRSVVGNIYVGRITNVLPGMNAAFVDIGVGKNALLYLQDLVLLEDGSHIKPRKIGKALKQHDQIVAQVTKDPMQSKGARLTTYLSLPGRMMVYIPQGNKSGISRRLPDKERDRLRRIAKEIQPEEGSTIIRTAAQGASKKDLQADLDYLVKQWEGIQKKIKRSQPPTRVYAEPDLATRVIRDNLTREYRKVLVDSESEHKKIVEYLAVAAPELKGRVKLYSEQEPLFKKYGVEQGIEAALRRKVSMPSGGYIVIDEAEALTAIDVNTGSYTGRKSLEDTVLKTNLEAAVEVVRQLRLRDIGGIIVIDFIDMENRDNRERVLETLEQELAKDRTKTQVVTLSRLGLVEMTRKNVTEGLAETLGSTCPRCEGRGLLFKQ